MNISKDTSHSEYLHGDFDKDGTPNIDDKKPFDPKNKETVSKSVSLSKRIRSIESKRKKAEKIAKRYAKKKKLSYRVKDTWSILDKAYKKGENNPNILGDLIGFRHEEDTTYHPLRQKWRGFNKSTPQRMILETEDKYRSLKGKRSVYRAFHTNINLGTKKNPWFAEVQYRTKKAGILNDLQHDKFYKAGKKPDKAFLKLARKNIKKEFRIGF